MPTAAQRLHEILRGFAGAHGTYEVEEFNEGKTKNEIKRSARTVRRPVTDEIWASHAAGEYHLGVITITEENTCWWGAVDVDDYTVDHTALVAQLSELHLPAVVCRTKSGGAHVLVFFSEPVPASDVMPRLRDLSAVLGYGGSEVFPKQMRVVSEQEGMGNWLNMPYFGGDTTKCYAVRPDGRGMSLEQFLRVAESSRMSRRDFMSLTIRRRTEGWEDGPPCLEHLAGLPGGIGQGLQNNALFSLAVLARKKSPDGWKELLHQWNKELCRPVHEHGRVQGIISSIEKREYGYKCHDAPCVSHCNMALCRQRKFGIGPGGGAAIIESVSILDTEPPLFFVNLRIGGVVECDGSVLLSPREFQKHVLDQLQIVIPQYRQETWLPQVQQAVEGATKIEAPQEVGTTGQLHELVERFCTDRHAAEQRDEIVLGKPWRDEDEGMVWFRLRDLEEFLDRSRFGKLGRGKMTERIKRMGGRHHFFNMQGKGVNVWGVPVDNLTWTNGKIPHPSSEEGPV